MAAVYVQTNEADANRLLAFARRDDGTLDPRGAVETGGRGDGVPHLTSQGSVLLAGGGRHLLVTNSGTGDVSLFALGDGPPQLLGTFASGPVPKSVAAHGDLVYVLNTGDASLAGFRLGDGRLDPLSGSRRELGAGADPAQVGFSPDGSKLVVTQRERTNSRSSRSALTAGSGGNTSWRPRVRRRTGSPLRRTARSSSPRPSGHRGGRPPRPRTHPRTARSRPSRARSATAAARSAGPSSRTTAATRSRRTSPTAPSPAMRSAPTGASRWRMPPPERHTKERPGCATRTSRLTGASSTRSTRTAAASSAGRSARKAH